MELQGRKRKHSSGFMKNVRRGLRQCGWHMVCWNKIRYFMTTYTFLVCFIVTLFVYDTLRYRNNPAPLTPVPSYHNDEWTRSEYQNDIDPNATKTDEGSSAVPGVTKVLLMTYMRGGSSLLGEMLNQDPHALYWFEPFDGVFSELYGSRHGWFPIDLLYDDNQRLRLFTEYEEEALLAAVRNLGTCDVSSLPTDTLAHYAMTHIPQKRLASYKKCLEDLNTNITIKQAYGVNGKIFSPWACKNHVSKYVPRHFSTLDKKLQKSWYCLHGDTNSPFKDSNITMYHGGQEFVPECETSAAAVSTYAECMKRYKAAMQDCVPLLQQACDNSTLVGIKAIRLRADLVQRLMSDDPHLKLVYQMRDPRGVVLSRRKTGLVSELSARNITKEAALLCQRISYDLSIVYNMEKQYPDRVLRLRYEDLVLEADESINQFFRFMNREIPEEVRSYLAGNVTDGEDVVNSYSTVRKNGTANVYQWQQQLTTKEIQSITNVCLDVLEHNSYSMLEL